jgi:hypothetical protein
MNQTNQFLDLEIRIAPRQGDAYPVEITLGSGQEFSGRLAASILPWISSGDSAADGRNLFQALFADPALRTAWAEARGQSPQRRIRFRIAAAAPELHAIPWELLRPDDAASNAALSADADTPFSRYLAVSKPWGSAVEERPLRVLAFISSPNDIEEAFDLTSLDLDVEQAALEKVFLTLDENEVELDFLAPPVTLERIEEALQTGYHILHYVGHGAFSKRRQQAALYLQDEEGETNIVLDTDFIEMLERQTVQACPRLVFLASCQTATRSTANAFLGLAPQLVTIGVPAVIAMQDFVAIETARKLSLTFYKRLAEHGMVDCALNQARSVLLTADHPDAAAPVLFMRLKSGQLWEDTATEAEEAAGPGSETTYNIHIEGGQVGVIGDGTKIEGGIHFGKPK